MSVHQICSHGKIFQALLYGGCLLSVCLSVSGVDDIFNEVEFSNEEKLLGEASSLFESGLGSNGDDSDAFSEFEFDEAGSLLKSRKVAK